jgi:hypothetical protein
LPIRTWPCRFGRRPHQRARDLLERHRVDPPDLICFEWRLLDRLCASSASDNRSGQHGRIWM